MSLKHRVLRQLEKKYVDEDDLHSEFEWYGTEGENDGMKDFAEEVIDLTLSKQKEENKKEGKMTLKQFIKKWCTPIEENARYEFEKDLDSIEELE